MAAGKVWNKNTGPTFAIGNDVFEEVKEFGYPVSKITHSNDTFRVLYETKQRVLATNTVNFALAKPFCSRILSRATQMTVYILRYD